MIPAPTPFGPRTVPAVSPRRTGLRGPNGVSFREAPAARRGGTAFHPPNEAQG